MRKFFRYVSADRISLVELFLLLVLYPFTLGKPLLIGFAMWVAGVLVIAMVNAIIAVWTEPTEEEPEHGA